MITQTAQNPVVGTKALTSYVEEKTHRLRRPLVMADLLLLWHAARTALSRLHIVGGGTPSRIGTHQVHSCTSAAKSTASASVGKARHRVSNTPTEIIDTGAIIAQCLSDTGDSGVTNTKVSQPLPRIRRHRRQGLYYDTPNNSSYRMLKIGLLIFVLVSWPSYGVAVWLIAAR